MSIQVKAAGEDLLELIEYWEDLSPDDQKVKVDREVDSLQSKLETFIDLSRLRRLANSPEIKEQIRAMRLQVDRLKSAGSALAITSSIPPRAIPTKTITQIKSRTLPLPTYSGDLSDWRSF